MLQFFLNALKFKLCAEHLTRCSEAEIIPTWSLKLEPWNIDLTEFERNKFVDLEKSAAKDSMSTLQAILLEREQSENRIAVAFDNALKGMLGEDNPKLSASSKVLVPLLKKEEVNQLNNYIKREGKWRENPVNESDIFTALSKGPKMNKLNPTNQGNIVRVANPPNHQNQNLSYTTRSIPYNIGRGGNHQGFQGGRKQDTASLGHNHLSTSVSKQPQENITPKEIKFLDIYRKYLQK